jgi:hypothetical protein
MAGAELCLSYYWPGIFGIVVRRNGRDPLVRAQYMEKGEANVGARDLRIQKPNDAATVFAE